MHLTLCSFIIAACALASSASDARARALRAGEGEAAGNLISAPGVAADLERARHAAEHGQQRMLQASSVEEIATSSRETAVGVLAGAGSDSAGGSGFCGKSAFTKACPYGDPQGKLCDKLIGSVGLFCFTADAQSACYYCAQFPRLYPRDYNLDEMLCRQSRQAYAGSCNWEVVPSSSLSPSPSPTPSPSFSCAGQQCVSPDASHRCISLGGRCPGGTASTPLICDRTNSPQESKPVYSCRDSICVDRCSVWNSIFKEKCYDVGKSCGGGKFSGINSVCIKDNSGARCVRLPTPSPSPKPCDTSVNCAWYKKAALVCVLPGEQCPDGTWCAGIEGEPPSCMELAAAPALSSAAGKPLADEGVAGRALQAVDASLEAAFTTDIKDAAAALSAGV
jgi:hypothetical protein